MKKEFYYNYDNAMAEATAYANANNGKVADHSAVCDDRTQFDYVDREARNLCWSGETSAIVVIDCDTYEEIAHFAWYE